MSLIKKANKINLDKERLNNLITEYKNIVATLNNQMEFNIDLNNQITDYLNNVNFYEIKKWESSKLSYIEIKKQITISKKLLKKINVLYGDIATYYTNDLKIEMNLLIVSLNDLNSNLEINFIKLKKVHNIASNILNKINKNNVNKINESNNEINFIVNKININQQTLKSLTKEIHHLKIIKLELELNAKNKGFKIN